METFAVDAVRDDIDGGKFASAPFLTQPVKSAFELLAGKLRVDHDPVGLFERRGLLFFGDPAVQRDVTGDLQPVTIWSENVQIMRKAPDVVQNENQRGIDLFDQSLRLVGREHVTALRIGRMNRQAAIADGFAGIADAQIMNLMTIREPPHDVMHHPRQTGAVGVEADGYDLEAGRGMTHRHVVFMSVPLHISGCRIIPAEPPRALRRTIPAPRSNRSAWRVCDV